MLANDSGLYCYLGIALIRECKAWVKRNQLQEAAMKYKTHKPLANIFEVTLETYIDDIIEACLINCRLQIKVTSTTQTQSNYII